MAKYMKQVRCINFNSHDEVKDFLLSLKNNNATVTAFDHQKPNFNVFAVATKYRKKEDKK